MTSDLLIKTVGNTPPDTLSLCPVCLERIDAWRWKEGDNVWLIKHCPRHGDFKTPIWRGKPSWEKWRRPKSPPPALVGQAPVIKGCPFDCGLCTEHRQRSCTVLVDVTRRCNLVCPVCFAASTPNGPADPGLKDLALRFEAIASQSPGSNIQLSGGEPTMRDDLPEIVELGKKAGFDFIQLNTNGIRLSQYPADLEKLADAGLDSLFLQFDGTQDAIFRSLRGKALFGAKSRTIQACRDVSIGVVLVVTVVPGVNTHNLGAILEFALDHVPTVRGVHFQPISYFGRYGLSPAQENRVTLPELMRAIDTQTGGTFPVDHFSPPGCENAMCSFSAKFLIGQGGSVRPLLPAWQGCCGSAEPALEGARRSIAETARQWSPIPEEISSAKSDAQPANPLKTSSAGDRGPMDLDQFILQARTRTFSVSAMAFQDAWNLDLERVRDCCIHVADEKNRLIPFCLCNLTSVSGKGLYRQ